MVRINTISMGIATLRKPMKPDVDLNMTDDRAIWQISDFTQVQNCTDLKSPPLVQLVQHRIKSHVHL